MRMCASLIQSRWNLNRCAMDCKRSHWKTQLECLAYLISQLLWVSHQPGGTQWVILFQSTTANSTVCSYCGKASQMLLDLFMKFLLNDDNFSWLHLQSENCNMWEFYSCKHIIEQNTQHFVYNLQGCQIAGLWLLALLLHSKLLGCCFLCVEFVCCPISTAYYSFFLQSKTFNSRLGGYVRLRSCLWWTGEL